MRILLPYFRLSGADSVCAGSFQKLNEIQDAIESKQIPKRVTHNDTRYSNVLIDSDSKKAICLIDLDTVMPGASILDFGDAVRAGAATFTEDEKIWQYRA